MKKFSYILGLVLIAAALVAVGWCLGIRESVLTEAYAIPTVDKHLTEASMTAMILHQIDSGRLDDARHTLQLQLDGEILTVDSLIDDADSRSRDLAQKVFARIAANRAEFPASYTGSLAQSDADVDAKIADILRKAESKQ
jgi:hypothetical protein